MAALLERERTVIVKHIGKIFSEGELDEKSNVQKLHIAYRGEPHARRQHRQLVQRSD